MARDDKKRPIEERIAALMGKSAYFDIRDGVGRSGPPAFSDQDVAAALGMVAAKRGRVACQVLETHYGSTLLHVEALLRAWEEREHRPGRAAPEVILTRFAGELAIRELASVRYGTPQLAHYAYLIFSRRERLQDRIADCRRWLEDIRENALSELRRVVRSGLAEEVRQAKSARVA